MIVKLEHAHNLSVVGNKAFQLAKLLQTTKNIPKGFVIPHNENNKDLIEEYITKNCSSKKLYAVRSSSNIEDSSKYSFAGMFDTFLGVKKEELLKHIILVKDSASSSRIDALKNEINLNTKVQVSVLVQEMVNASVSGICFTANPMTGKSNEFFIEAGIGLGEFIVSNEVTPDSYVVTKSSMKIKKKIISCQHKALFLSSPPVEKAVFAHTQKLSNELVLSLSEVSERISKSLGFAADIEWCVDRDNNLIILQARPITFVK